MTATPQPVKLLKIREYAAHQNISIRTAQRWIAMGALKVERIGPTGRIRIRVETLES